MKQIVNITGAHVDLANRNLSVTDLTKVQISHLKLLVLTKLKKLGCVPVKSQATLLFVTAPTINFDLSWIAQRFHTLPLRHFLALGFSLTNTVISRDPTYMVRHSHTHRTEFLLSEQNRFPAKINKLVKNTSIIG